MNIMPVMPTSNKNRTQHKQSFGIRWNVDDFNISGKTQEILTKYTQNLPSDHFSRLIDKLDIWGQLGSISSKRETQPVFKLIDDPNDSNKMLVQVVSPILDTDNSVEISYNAIPGDFVAAVKKLAKKVVRALNKEENRLFVPNKRLSQILKEYESKHRQIEEYDILQKGKPYSGIILSDPDKAILRIINSLPKNDPSMETFLNAIDPKTGELARITSTRGTPIKIKISNEEPVKYDSYGIYCHIDTCSTTTGFSIPNEKPLQSLLKNIKKRVDATQDYRTGRIWDILHTRH